MDTDKMVLEEFINNHPAQAAQAIEMLSDDDIAAFMETLPLSLNVRLLNQLKIYKGAKCLQSVRPELAKDLVEDIDIALAESLLRQCDSTFRFALLNSMHPKRAAVLRQKLEYEADTIGALMVPSIFALEKTMLIKDAITIIKLEKERIPTTVYLINDEEKLEGKINLRDLFLADLNSPLVEIMKTEIPTFFADLKIKSVANHPAWHKYRSIPVIDRSGKLLGILDFATSQKSESEVNEDLGKQVLETSNSLGELFRIGLTGFLQSISK